MKIGDIIDLRIGQNKQILDALIQGCGISRDINQLALTVNCEDNNGVKFAIVQFHNSRHLVHILSH